ncbi:GLPGLI family protein [Niabella pedocola]|uniref:GLPGLI family protein n=1 Tax=Niabella pedocola TaxID=1752077 RepID=A0ABS8PX63_9BACT|nr:GLPGLI family protein [Niabella pedocola]MCD2425419.1 GLPGLI family protein [Niabella pedocola]
MKKLLLCGSLFMVLSATAQKFITSGTIEYEVRKNQKKEMSRFDTDEDDNGFWAQIKDKVPQFSLNYYTYQFNETSGLYKFTRTADKQKMPMWFSRGQEDNVWYNNYAGNTFTNVKVIDDNYLISGPLKPINWKISPNDQRIIAGFNCRKATAVMFDSVYVFAYYTDEITVSGGPMGLHGLPGMILGVTIPRMYTSWVATSLTLNAGTITPPSKGKKKTDAEIMQALVDLSKSWGKDGAKYLQPTIWQTFL